VCNARRTAVAAAVGRTFRIFRTSELLRTTTATVSTRKSKYYRYPYRAITVITIIPTAVFANRTIYFIYFCNNGARVWISSSARYHLCISGDRGHETPWHSPGESAPRSGASVRHRHRRRLGEFWARVGCVTRVQHVIYNMIIHTRAPRFSPDRLVT